LREGLVDHFVTLERIPDHLRFPEKLADRIWYDPAAKRLCFRGYMSKTEFDLLCELSRDWSFRRKLEELFQICIDSDETKPRPKGWHGLFSIFRRNVAPS
jgi:hypothetical protein